MFSRMLVLAVVGEFLLLLLGRLGGHSLPTFVLTAILIAVPVRLLISARQTDREYASTLEELNFTATVLRWRCDVFIAVGDAFSQLSARAARRMAYALALLERPRSDRQYSIRTQVRRLRVRLREPS
jgi:hypothetical protein